MYPIIIIIFVVEEAQRSRNRSRIFTFNDVLMYQKTLSRTSHITAPHGAVPQYLSDQLQYVADLPTRRRGRFRSCDFFSTSARRDVLPSAIGRLLLPALDFRTVYLLTSGLPRHSQHFVGS